MNKFGPKSIKNLDSCHPDLQRLFEFVIDSFDCSVLCGYRGEEDQNRSFRDNRSALKYPKSKHNSYPSMAVDVVPYPIDWEKIDRFYFFGGYVKAVAQILGIKIRWGGDWDSDTLTDDQRFNDLPHFELI